MHAFTHDNLSRSHAPQAPVPIVRDPVDQGELFVSDGRLVSAHGERSYRVHEGPEKVYDLFVRSDAASRSLRCDAEWNPNRFDEHYEDVGYYEDGADYEAKTGIEPTLTAFHHARVKDVLLEWLSPAPDHTIMDVGCGAGWFLERICRRYQEAGHNPMAIGLEASRMQARFTARRLSRMGNGGVALLGNAERLPFADETFDLVTCSETLEQVENPIRAVEEMARVLKPGGRLLLSAPSRLGEVVWDTVLSPALALAKAIRRSKPTAFGEYYAALYPEELEAQVRHAGLVTHAFVQNGVIPHNHYFSQLPHAAVKPLVKAFDWFDRRYSHAVPQLAAHVLLWAEKPHAV